MSEIFFISDTHFQHAKILTFKDGDTQVRPGFRDVTHMDSVIIANWNKTVAPNDIIYHLGDVAWKTNKRTKEILGSLNGKKRLCIGNHDDVDFLYPFFERTYLWKYFPDFNFIASHVPLTNLADLARTGANVHGHLHNKSITLTVDGKTTFDNRFLNVSVEQTNYTPVHIEEVINALPANVGLGAL